METLERGDEVHERKNGIAPSRLALRKLGCALVAGFIAALSAVFVIRNVELLRYHGFERLLLRDSWDAYHVDSLPSLQALPAGAEWIVIDGGLSDKSAAAELTRFHSLSTVSFAQESTFGDGVATTLGDIATIETIDLSKSIITDNGLRQLARARELKYLSLNYCVTFTCDGLEVVLGGTQIKDLDLVGCKQLDLACVDMLRRKYPWCSIRWSSD